MNLRKTLIALATASVCVALPAVVMAHHKPGHGTPGGGGPLSLTAKPGTVVYGGATTLSGRLTGANNSGRAVQLREDRYPYGDGFKPVNVPNATTSANGSYSFTLRPGVNTIYRTTVGNDNSPNVLVNVRIRMSLRVSDRTPAVGQLVRFRGRACPKHERLAVAIQRRSSTGRYITVRRTRLKAAPTCSSYSRTFRIYRDGRYRVTADDRDHARGYSRSRVLDAHR